MEQATNRKLKRERWPKKPMPSGKPKDMLTWAGYTGSLRQRKDEGFTPALAAGASVTGVFDVLKTAEYNQSSAVQPEQETSREGLFVVVLVTTARMLRSRMKGNFHVRFCTGGGAGNRSADQN